jgi:predicted alpha/beta hydrolase family esterase
MSDGASGRGAESSGAASTDAQRVGAQQDGQAEARPILVCLHGYGVRGWMWQWLGAELAAYGLSVETPDLEMSSIEELMASTKSFVQELAREREGAVCLLGHSLGGVAAATVARDLGPEVVGRVAILSAPYGTQENLPGPLMQFLLQHQLLPDLLVRPNFFSAKTPKKRQKYIFANAVPESDALRETVFAPTWFHTDTFTETLPQPSIAVASEADRIVPFHQTRAFAETLGARLVRFEASRRVGHDDLFAAPEIVRELGGILGPFMTEQ